MVATSQPLAGRAGLRMLENGGTAADAAVAAAATLQVTQPCSTGLGGDAFFLYYEASSRRVFALNGSGRSPAALSLELLANQEIKDEIPDFHAHTVTVPGAPRAWQDLHDRFGRLPRDGVIAPAIELAEQGFPVSPMTSVWWRAGAARQLAKHSHGSELLIDGRGPEPGEVIRLPALARSLREFAGNGAEAFYTGWIADEILHALTDEGSVMSADDLAGHRSEWVQPMEISYRGARILECPPNGQGLAALIALNVLRHLENEEDLPRNADDSALRARHYHRMIESMRVGFAEAAEYVADPDFATIPVSELLDESYGAQRAKLILDNRRLPEVRPMPDLGTDTVYFCTVDGSGNACSFINSNFQGFGTGIVPRGCGFSLQNRGKGFSLDPSHRNKLEPAKRPYHTIIPGLALRTDGTLLCPFGVMGGMMQPQGHLQVVSGLIDEGLDPQSALDKPRFQLTAGNPQAPVLFEAESDPETARKLAEIGHHIRDVAGRGRATFGLGQVIVRDTAGVLWGGSDPRGDGCAVPALP
jgi:gamma-glutamyltranspeptidase/glutathione hydrolase